MKTTVTLDPEIAAKAKAGAATLGKTLKEVINAALRVGLDAILSPPAAQPYKTKPHPMGLRKGLNGDKISALEGDLELMSLSGSVNSPIKFPGIEKEKQAVKKLRSATPGLKANRHKRV